MSHTEITDFPKYLPLLAFPNTVLTPDSSENITLEGPQGLSLLAEVIKNKNYLGVVQMVDHQGETDLFTTGTLAKLRITDMTTKSVTFNLLGLRCFDVQEFIKTDQNFYAAKVSYTRYETKEKEPKNIDRASLLHSFKRLLSYLDYQDFDMNLFEEHSDERLVKELMDFCPLGNLEKQHILETSALEQQTALLRQYIEESMLGPLVAFTRH